MTSRFHKAVTKAEAEYNKVIAEEERYLTEVYKPLGTAMEYAQKAYEASKWQDKDLCRAYTKARQKWGESGREHIVHICKRQVAQRVLALRRRQLEDFLVRKVSYDRVKVRKTQTKSKCIEIGIMKIYMPL